MGSGRSRGHECMERGSGGMKHIRYAVKKDNGYIRRKGSSCFEVAPFEKADLYLSTGQAQVSAKRHGGKLVLVGVNLKEVVE